MKNPWAAPIKPLRSPSLAGLIVRGKLTDRQIERYREAGWYSNEIRELRRERAKRRRFGNFVRNDDGSLIYSPI